MIEHARATRTTLGRTGLEACRIGIGGGSGLSTEDLEYAVSRGVNYLFASSDFHAVLYHPMARFLRRHRNDSVRDGLVVAGCSYIADPEKLAGILADQLLSWNLEYIDVFVWGWVNERNNVHELMHAADDTLRSPAGAAAVAEQIGVAAELGAELRRRGYARHLGVSTHDRSIARALLTNPRCDSLMVRYNIAHRGLEDDVFPHLAAPADRPAIVAFNALHDARGTLLRPPPHLPAGRYVPTASDLYRFALDRPEVDVVLSGPADRGHVDAALDALTQAPLDPAVRAYLAKYGDLHSRRPPPAMAPRVAPSLV